MRVVGNEEKGISLIKLQCQMDKFPRARDSKSGAAGWNDLCMQSRSYFEPAVGIRGWILAKPGASGGPRRIGSPEFPPA